MPQRFSDISTRDDSCCDVTALARMYLDHLAVERGLSDLTIDAYRADITDYVSFLKRSGAHDLPRR